jgi:hypothetical protein
MLFAVWGAMTVLISGRNKMIFMPMVFLGIIAMAFIYKSSINRLATIALSLLCAGLIFLGVFLQVSLDREYTRYVSYGTGYASERLTDSTIGAVVTTFRQSGFFGEGLGTASLGKRFAGNTNVATWQESGLSRLMVELGVMGFIAAALFVMGVMWTFYRMMKFMPRGSPLLPIYAGMMGILAANGASFIISHQIFGDPFIIILTGLLVGITLSVPFWPNGQLGGGAGS